MTKESTKSNIKLGDFVLVQYEYRNAIGVVINGDGELHRLTSYSITPETRKAIIDDPCPVVIAVRLGQHKTDMVFLKQCRKLTGKEIFKAKLSDNWDDNLKYDKVKV